MENAASKPSSFTVISALNSLWQSSPSNSSNITCKKKTICKIFLCCITSSNPGLLSSLGPNSYHPNILNLNQSKRLRGYIIKPEEEIIKMKLYMHTSLQFINQNPQENFTLLHHCFCTVQLMNHSLINGHCLRMYYVNGLQSLVCQSNFKIGMGKHSMMKLH